MKNFIFVLLAVLSFACSNMKQNSLTGEWKNKTEETYIFSEDGRGIYQYTSVFESLETIEFTYQTIGDTLILNDPTYKTVKIHLDFLTSNSIKTTPRIFGGSQTINSLENDNFNILTRQ